MNDEFPRRPTDDEPDRQPDFGFGGAPLFRDEVPPPDGPGPGATGFHDASMFRDPASTDPLGDSGGGYRSGDYGSGDYRGGDYGTGTTPGLGGETAPSRVPGLEYGAGGDYGTGLMSGFGGGADTLSSSGGFPAQQRFAESGGAAGGEDRLSSSGRHATMAGDSGVPPQRFGGPGDAAEMSGPGGPGGSGSGGSGGSGGPGGFGGGAAEPQSGDPQWAPNEGPLRVVPADQASALLRIKLPDAPPVPSTTLRGDAAIETVVEASQMLHRVSPAKPNALPGDVLALTTATMVVPMPGAAFGGVLTVQRSARLTASVPPDLASRAEADLLSDTVEQFFGDFDAIGRELEAQRASGAAAAAGSVTPAVPAQGGGVTGTEVSQPPVMPGQYAPSAPSSGPAAAGRYGVPTQVPGYDAAARRSPVGMRYLGGIFHDSSGESSFYDPSTEALVPMGAAAFSAADFRRTAPAITRPVPPPRTGPGAAPPRTGPSVATPPRGTAGGTSPASAGPRGSSGSSGSAGSTRSTRGGGSDQIHYFIDDADHADDTKVLPTGHWSDHHPDHHRSPRRRRRGRLAVISGVSVALVFGTLYGAALAFEGQVPKGTIVDGVAIGGMSRTAAAAKLSAALGPTLNAPIQLTADGTTFRLVPNQSGLNIDYAGTVAAAASGRTDPTVAIPALAGTGRDVPLRVSVDRDALKTALTNLTAGFDKPMVDGSVIFPGGVPTPIAPRPGRQVDVDAAVDAVLSAFDNGVASARLAAMSPAGPAGVLPTAPAAYAIVPEKTAVSPTHRYARSHEKQSPSTPSPSSTPSDSSGPSDSSTSSAPSD
uniref:peptidoglycan binding domain-containing protein n=1 Tax=Catenulispora pinisilvae TaxID=2705253 RepID=UPI00189180A7